MMTLAYWQKRFGKVFLPAVAFAFVLLLSLLGYSAYFLGLIHPGIYILGLNASGKYPNVLANELETKFPTPTEIKLSYQGQETVLNAADLGLAYDFSGTSLRAYNLTRTGNFVSDTALQFSLLFNKKELALSFVLDETAFEKVLSNLSEKVGKFPEEPSISILSGKLVVTKGKAGTILDKKETRIALGRAISTGESKPIETVMKSVDNTLSDKEVEMVKKRAEKFLGKTLTLSYEDKNIAYKDADLVGLIDPREDYKKDGIDKIVAKTASTFNRQPTEPTFVVADGRASEFAASKDGLAVKTGEFEEKLYETLSFLVESEQKTVALEIPITRTPPKIKTGDINNLGIKELLGKGISRFRGSIPERVHNIATASARFKGVLVPPNETFSFNKILGDVSAFTGFKQAYIIKDGKTILGDGGGVCQVSSTLFRAILNAGLPVIERRAHSYRVAYYEQDSQPGFDATVFDPSPDLKFLNDTPAHLLIQPVVDTKSYSLAFEIYGTSDGRVAITSKPKVSDLVEPPPDLYQDDPNLPAGKIKQIDYKAWGSKVVFDYTIKRGGEIVYSKTFVSNYHPWQAVYLRGTGPSQ